MGEVKDMRQWNALRSYPQPEERVVGERTIEDRILASYRGRDFFDGPRSCGYGGMHYDGRWREVAGDIISDYNPQYIIELQCEKAFLLYELKKLGMNVCGVESSSYARRTAKIEIVSAPPPGITYDLCIAKGVVYTLPLDQAMNMIRGIEKLAHKAFITLAAYETEKDLNLFRRWTLLGTTILKKDEWREVLKHCGYTGDYWFVTAESLRLRENTDNRRIEGSGEDSGLDVP